MFVPGCFCRIRPLLIGVSLLSLGLLRDANEATKVLSLFASWQGPEVQASELLAFARELGETSVGSNMLDSNFLTTH